MYHIRINTRRWFLLGAILFLIGVAAYFHFAMEGILNALLQERFAAVKYEAEHICSIVDYLVDRDGGWEVEKYQGVFSFLVGKMDATSNSYAELLDEQLNKLSERHPVFPSKTFDPKEYPDFLQLLLTENSGDYMVMFDPMDGETAPHPLYLYWRWVPTGKQHENRLLLIVGCTQYSVNARIADWLIYGILALFFISTIYAIGSLMILTVEKRKGDACSV